MTPEIDAKYTDMALKHYGCKDRQCPVDSENAFLEGQTQRRLLDVRQILPNRAYVIPHKKGYTIFATPDESEMRRYDQGVFLLNVDTFSVYGDASPNGQRISRNQMMNVRQKMLEDIMPILVPKREFRKGIEKKIGRKLSEDN